MEMLVDPKGGGQVLKVPKASKNAASKGSVGSVKNVFSSSADALQTDAPEKAKIQDKSLAIAAPMLDVSGSKAKIQDKTPNKGVEASAEAQIQDKDMGKATVSGRLSSHDMSELRQIAANLRPLSDRSGVQLHREPQILARDVVSPSRGVEAAEGSSLACDEVPANTFVMSAQAVEPFVAAANRIRLPQVEDELVLHGGDTLYKSLLSSQFKLCCLTLFISFLCQSLAITHASHRQYRELSRMKADRDSLRKDLSVLETKVKEKEEALALSEKRLAELSSEKKTLSKSAADFKAKVDSLDKEVEKLDTGLAKAQNDNEDLRGKVDVTDQEFATLVEAERLCLSGICDALVSVGTTPEQLPGDASIEHYQAWLSTNIPYVVKACRTFLNNAVHLAVRDLLHSLEAGGSDVLARAVSDSFSLVSTNITPPSLVEALFMFSDHIDESFWSRVLAIGRQPQSEDSSDFSLSEFASPKPSADAPLSKCATPESSSDISLSEFATPEPSSHGLARHEPPIEIFSSPSEIHLSSDSDPLSPVEGGVDSFTFPPGGLVAIGRPYNYGPDVSKGRGGHGKRGSRGRRSQGGPSSSRGSVRKKRGGRSRRNPSVNLEGSPPCFDAALQVERMVSSRPFLFQNA
ncbi:hypothetical protein EJB05_56574, partial [Eragrostis curvula]